MELCDANGSSFAHVGVVVGEAFLQGVVEISRDGGGVRVTGSCNIGEGVSHSLRNPVDANAAHSPHGQGADQRVRIVGVLHEGIDH